MRVCWIGGKAVFAQNLQAEMTQPFDFCFFIFLYYSIDSDPVLEPATLTVTLSSPSSETASASWSTSSVMFHPLFAVCAAAT